jgi:GntR family transcriptional regulator/MocR family aminotransferase
MSLSRRLELLQWASRSKAWVLEDDYDSEFRYGGRPIAALQGIDTEDRVIYLGTFSKVMFPSLRLGYLVVPPELVDAFAAARAFVDRHPPSLDQAVLADFIAEGHFERHIRRMRMLYAERQAAFVRAAEDELSPYLQAQPQDCGLHLIGWLPEGVDGMRASKCAKDRGVEAPSLSSYALRPQPRQGLVLGYAAFREAEISTGARLLRGALASLGIANRGAAAG